MPQYTTGELARLCDVSVRTVQFYDSRNLLKPTALSEGGRRLYSEDDLRRLRLICLLKSLGLSLNSIKGILQSDAPEAILLLLLEEQEKALAGEIGERKKQLQAIAHIRQSIRSTNAIPVQSIDGMERMMNSKKKLKKVHGTMLAVGIVMDLIQLFTVLLWIFRGIWLPFAIGMPIVLLMGAGIFRMYHKNTAYICPACSAVFQPGAREMLFSKHTPKARKLTCPHCGHTGYCVETARDAAPSPA